MFKVFGKNKARSNAKGADERLARRLLGKDSGRRVFGFQCFPDIQASLKVLADQLRLPLYSVAEHALQRDAIQIAQVNKDADQREQLCRHIAEVHIEMRTIEKISRYDEEAAEALKAERIRRSNIEGAAHQLVLKFARFRPEELEELIILGYRCRLAIADGWGGPSVALEKSYQTWVSSMDRRCGRQ